jgi:hypothetical protein
MSAKAKAKASCLTVLIDDPSCMGEPDRLARIRRDPRARASHRATVAERLAGALLEKRTASGR